MTVESEISELLTTVGQRLLTARKSAGLSRKQLIASADISERYLAQLEAGQANASLEKLYRIASALNLDWNTLLSLNPVGTNPLPNLGIALTGLRGAGKSTLGKLLAETLQLPFIQLSQRIETGSGLETSEIFNLGGDALYRKFENEAVKTIIANGQQVVLETTGGIVSNKITYDLVRENFTTVWLQASPQDHMNRVIDQGDIRPISGNDHAMEHLESLLRERKENYALAHHTLCTSQNSLTEGLKILVKIAD